MGQGVVAVRHHSPLISSAARLDHAAGGGAPCASARRRRIGSPGRARVAARTLREDRWWLQPLVTFICFSAWLLYGLVRAATQKDYFVADYGYLTPFASPCLSTSCVPGSTHFGTPFGDWPPLIPFAV